MKSYRLARRAFLASVGGAVGLKVLLGNLEAAAEGAKAPPRFLLAHWPLGTLQYQFVPTGSGSTYVTSPIAAPFEAAGLRDDMSIFFGFSDSHLKAPGGGGAEAGTPFTTTCCDCPGTRQNGGERDDAVAGGPSFDQIFLKRVPGLSRQQGTGYVNAICDARVDSFETGPRCLSYAYDTRSVPSNQAGDITEHVPLEPSLDPLTLYKTLFAGLMPGGATPDNQAAALTALKLRKSVLDYALDELSAVKRLAPGSEAPKLDLHADAIRSLERQLEPLAAGSACNVPAAPGNDLVARSGNAPFAAFVDTDDSPRFKSIAEAHLGVILAAMQCDLLRVATFQFMPGTNHVGFGGLWPGDPTLNAVQYPVTHRQLNFSAGDPSALSAAERNDYDFLVNVEVWLNQRLAEFLQKLKQTEDGFGSTLLDSTVIPYVTEIATPNLRRSPKPAFLFGGRALGLQHGTFRQFDTPRPQVDLYLTCAQALLGTADPLSVLNDERFVMFNPGAMPIDGLWAPPA